MSHTSFLTTLNDFVINNNLSGLLAGFVAETFSFSLNTCGSLDGSRAPSLSLTGRFGRLSSIWGRDSWEFSSLVIAGWKGNGEFSDTRGGVATGALLCDVSCE